MKNSVVFSIFQLKVLWENRRTAAFLWLSPIFFLFMLAFIGKAVFEEEIRVASFQIAVVNKDNSIETKLVIQQLTENQEITKLITTLQVNEERAKYLMKNNEIAAIIYIPKGFSYDVSRGINIPVKVVGNKNRPLQAQLVRHLMNSAGNYTSAAQSGINTVNDFIKSLDIVDEERRKEVKQTIFSFSLHVLSRNEIYIEEKQHNLFQQNIMDYYFVSFSVLLLMVWSYISTILVSQQSNIAIRKRLVSLGVSTFQIMVSTFISCFLLVFISSLVFVLPLFMGTGLMLGVNKSLFIVGIGSVCALFSALFIMLQSFFKKEKIYQSVGMFFILFGTITGGHLLPVIYFPEWLKTLSNYSMNKWIFQFILAFIQEFSSYSFLMFVCGFFLLIIVFFAMARLAIVFRSYWKEGE